MTIPTSSLRAFLQQSSRLKTNTLLPVLSFIKFENGTITKHTMREFMQYSIPFDGQFMVEERILNTFISGSQDDEIDFSWTDKKVTLKDSKGKISSPNEPLINFPAIDLPTESEELTEAACRAIGVCAQMLSDEELAIPNCKHVFTGGSWISGTDGFIGTVFDIECPSKIILAKQPAMVVAKMKGCQYSNTKAYDLFQSGDLLYGSVKPEVVWFDMSILRHKSTDGFDLDTREVLSFCDMAIAASGLSVMTATIENGHELRLQFSEPEYGVELSRVMQVAGPHMEAVGFQPRLMQRLLRALPAAKVICVREFNRLSFLGDGFTGMIQEFVQLKNQ